jgi:hypothetical protein
MSMKKKAVSVSLSVSMLMSTAAIAPISVQQLMNNGVQPYAQAFGLAPEPIPSEVVDKMNSVRDNILPEDVAIVENAKQKMAELDDVNIVFDNVWQAIAAKIDESPDPSQFNLLTPVSILKLMRESALMTYADPSGIESLRVSPEHRPVMEQLELLGSSDPDNPIDLVPNDFVDFFDAVHSLVLSESFNSLNFSNIEGLIKDKIRVVLEDNTYALSQVFNNIGITFDQLDDMKNKIYVAVDPEWEAYHAVALAYVRDGLNVTTSYSDVTKFFTPEFSVYDVDMPVSFEYLNWTKESGDEEVTISEDGTVTLSNNVVGGETYSADIRLTVQYTNLFGDVEKEVFTETMDFEYLGEDTEAPTAPTDLMANNVGLNSVELSWTESTDNALVFGYKVYVNGEYVADAESSPFELTGLTPSTNYKVKLTAIDTADNESDFSNEISFKTQGDSVLEVVDSNVDNILNSLDSDLNVLENQLATTTNPAKQDQIKTEMKKEYDQALADLAKFIVTPMVDGNNITMDTDLFLADGQYAFNKINELTDSLDETVEANRLNKKVHVDLGTTELDQANLQLDQEMLAGLSEQNIETLSVKLNHIVVNIPTAGITEDVSFSLVKQTVPTYLGDKSDTFKNNFNQFQANVSSDVYSLTLNSNLPTNTSLPITMSIPTPVVADPSTLTLVKIVNGKQIKIPAIINGGNVEKNIVLKNNEQASFAVLDRKVTYNDLAPVNSWAGNQIGFIASKGIVDEKANGIFNPKKSVTRAEFAKMLIVAFSLEDDQATANYPDVDENKWYYPHVAAATKHGIMTGRKNGNLDPNGNLTREEMSAMVTRTLKVLEKRNVIENPESLLSTFSDNMKASPFAMEPMASLVDAGILEGANGKIKPKTNATRAEAALVMYRLFNHVYSNIEG